MSSLTPQNCKEDGDVIVRERGGRNRQTNSQRNRERGWTDSEIEAEERQRKTHREIESLKNKDRERGR